VVERNTELGETAGQATRGLCQKKKLRVHRLRNLRVRRRFIDAAREKKRQAGMMFSR
jgi:hypothetical protein